MQFDLHAFVLVPMRAGFTMCPVIMLWGDRYWKGVSRVSISQNTMPKLHVSWSQIMLGKCSPTWHSWQIESVKFWQTQSWEFHVITQQSSHAYCLYNLNPGIYTSKESMYISSFSSLSCDLLCFTETWISLVFSEIFADHGTQKMPLWERKWTHLQISADSETWSGSCTNSGAM